MVKENSMKIRFTLCISLILCAIVTICGNECSRNDDDDDSASSADSGSQSQESGTLDCDVNFPDHTVGLTRCQTGVTDGYLLYPVKHRGDVYLINRLGEIVHHWNKSLYEPGQSCYLRDNGNLVRAAMPKGGFSIGGGEGGRLEEYDWDDNLVWAFDFASPSGMTHHDFTILPSGNLLMLAVEKKEASAAAAVGFDTTKLQDGYVAPEMVIEVKKTGDTTFEVVWEWHVWDHLVQNSNPSLADYGDPKQFPGRLEVKGGGPAFWNHANSIKYNPSLDQIIISARSHNEFWVIDHSTTTAEAATHSGGKYSKGGDFLYRWGNPSTYGAGNSSNQQLYQQHDAQWIEPDYPGAGNILIFNNGLGRPDGAYSSIDELIPPVDSNGNYPSITSGQAWGPSGLTWQFIASPPTNFYSPEISGAQRLPTGNTLVCEGVTGRFFEVTSDGQIVWEYVNPVNNAGPMSQYEKAPLDPKGHPENAVFKGHWYPLDFPGFSERDLSPQGVIEDDDTTCPVDNANYQCQARATCGSNGGTDDSAHFSCTGTNICCFKLVQENPKP
jgi:hypothetical protein